MTENNETIQVLEERKELTPLEAAIKIWNQMESGVFENNEDKEEIIAYWKVAIKTWEKIESELLENTFESDEAKEVALKECFEGKRKFPWHAQGQSIKVTDAKIAKAVITTGGLPVLGGSLTGRPEYEAEMDVPNKEVEPNREIRMEISHEQDAVAILKEIEEVRNEYPHAILGVNILYTIGDFEKIVRAVGDQGLVDILYVGAGIPYDLSEIIQDYPKMRYMAIVSSAQAVRLLEDTSERSKSKGERRPDGYVYEHKVAAGHNAKINPRKDKSAEDHIKEMKEVIGFKEDEKTLNKPIIFAGGVKYQEDVQRALLPEEYGGMGVNGVGLGTRLNITDECPIPNETIKSVHLNPDIPVVRRENFSPTKLPSTGKINEELFWKKVDEIALYTKIRCDRCILSKQLRDLYGEALDCPFMSKDPKDIDYKFCIGFFLEAAIRGEPWGLYFMSAINEKDPIYVKNGERYVPTVSEMIDYVIRGKDPEWATEEK